MIHYFAFIFIFLAKAEEPKANARLVQTGECSFSVKIEEYVKESVESKTENNMLYIKGMTDISKEDSYFYYKFDIPPTCTGKPMLGYTGGGINILFKKVTR